MIDWLRCLLRIHVPWPNMNLRDSIAFECRRCHATKFIRTRRKR